MILCRIEYLQQKYDHTKNDIEKKILTKQIQEAESEMDDIKWEFHILFSVTLKHNWNFNVPNAMDYLQIITTLVGKMA